MKNTPEYIAEKAVTLFLQSEIGDYSHFDNWKIDYLSLYEDQVYAVHVCFSDRNRSLEFKVDTSQVKIEEDEGDFFGDLEICMYEDIYEVTRTYDYTIKYFWMCLLKWD